MTGLEPIRHRPPPIPLTGAARFIRGFTRIGAVLSATAVLVGVITTGVAAYYTVGTRMAEFDQMQCIRSKWSRGAEMTPRWNVSNDIDLTLSGCDGPRMYMPRWQLPDLPIERPSYADLIAPVVAVGFGITFICALLPLVGFFLIGWIAAGFTRF